MADPLQQLLSAGVVPQLSLPPTSRYADVGIAHHAPEAEPGVEPVPVAFLRRRLVPKPERFSTLYEVRCVEGDRRDLLAARHYGDVELWWRLADANGVIDPIGMAGPPGHVVRVTLPVDMRGADG